MNLIFKLTILALTFASVPVLSQQEPQEIKLSHVAKQGAKALGLTAVTALLSFVVFKELTHYKNIQSYLLLNIPATLCTTAVGVYISMLNYSIIRPEVLAIRAAIKQHKEQKKRNIKQTDSVKKFSPYHVTFKF